MVEFHLRRKIIENFLGEIIAIAHTSKHRHNGLRFEIDKFSIILIHKILVNSEKLNNIFLNSLKNRLSNIPSEVKSAAPRSGRIRGGGTGIPSYPLSCLLRWSENRLGIFFKKGSRIVLTKNIFFKGVRTMVDLILDQKFRVSCLLGVLLFASLGHFGQVGVLAPWVTSLSWFIACIFLVGVIFPG